VPCANAEPAETNVNAIPSTAATRLEADKTTFPELMAGNSFNELSASLKAPHCCDIREINSVKCDFSHTFGLWEPRRFRAGNSKEISNQTGRNGRIDTI
jgi:hypothetical protein